MPVLVQYLLKLSVSLAVVFLFYRFILRPLTFYTWNRWYLLGYSAIAFVIPFVDINPFLAKAAIAKSEIISFIPVIDPRYLQHQSWFNLHNSWNQLLLLFLAGVVVMLVRLTAQMIAYRRLKRNSELLSENPVKLYQVDKDIVPFSFGNAIFVNQEQHNNDELREIIRHEFIHVKQRHTADMIWAEILCIINWYNPFAWMIKKVIRQNLEFIADQQVLENGLDRKEYQYLLLKVAGGASFRITNQFNFSFLKKRIAMMNKMKSARLHLVKFAFVFPLIAVLLLSFRNDIQNLIIIESRPAEIDSDTTPRLLLSNMQGQVLLYDTATRDYIGGEYITGIQQIHTAIGSNVFAGESKLYSTDVSKYYRDSIQKYLQKSAGVYSDTVPIFDPSNKNPPMFIVDEIIRSAAYVYAIEPEDIDRIEVLKDESALQYGDKGKNGVVRIYLKKDRGTITKLKLRKTDPVNKEELMEVRITVDSASKKYGLQLSADSMTMDASNMSFQGRNSNLRIRGVSTSGHEPLYVIDGVVQPKSADNLGKLDPNSIESLSVLKDASATALYGEAAINGVILIVTKKDKTGNGVKERDSINGKPVIKLQLRASGQKRPVD